MKHDNDQHQGPTYETSDIHVRSIVIFVVVLAISTLVILLAMQYYTKFLETQQEKAELPPASRVNPPGTRRLPPLPRLQGAPGSELLPLDEMKKVQAEEKALVENYGWVDKGTGVVRIPIEEAKRIILERGMPARSAAAAPSASPGASTPPPASGVPAPVKGNQ